MVIESALPSFAKVKQVAKEVAPFVVAVPTGLESMSVADFKKQCFTFAASVG